MGMNDQVIVGAHTQAMNRLSDNIERLRTRPTLKLDSKEIASRLDTLNVILVVLVGHTGLGNTGKGALERLHGFLGKSDPEFVAIINNLLSK